MFARLTAAVLAAMLVTSAALAQAPSGTILGGIKDTQGAVVPGATVVALDEEQNVFLVKEYKYAVERETIELISGGIDPGEEPVAAAIRELHEETTQSLAVLTMGIETAAAAIKSGGPTPRLDEVKGDRLVPIPGLPPSLARVPPGCPFHTRCPEAIAVRKKEYPEWRTIDSSGSVRTPHTPGGSAPHTVRCHVEDVVRMKSAKALRERRGEAPEPEAPASVSGAKL